MAYIEKLCEYVDHDTPIGVRDYDNTLQICTDHKDDFTAAVCGKDHIIYVIWNDFGEMYDFHVFVEGQGPWMRWFFNRRKWRRNMRKLLGVRQLNIVNVNTHKKLAEFELLKSKCTSMG